MTLAYEVGRKTDAFAFLSEVLSLSEQRQSGPLVAVIEDIVAMLNFQSGDHWDHNNNVVRRGLKRRNVVKIT